MKVDQHRQIRSNIMKNLESIRQGYSNLLGLAGELGDNTLENSFKTLGITNDSRHYRCNIGKVDYYNIFLALDPNRVNVFAETNCHYPPLFLIEPYVENFLGILNQEIDELKKLL